MALKIAQLGQPILRQRAEEISSETLQSEEFQQFIDDMLSTVTEAHGAGLAGPQVFSNKRIFLAAVLPTDDEDEIPGMEVFINPKLSATTEEATLAWEGCLSFLELVVLVPRVQGVKVDYLDRNGKAKTLELTDWPARVVQHEYDHLDGILTIDRAPSTKYIVKASEIDAAREALKVKE